MSEHERRRIDVPSVSVSKQKHTLSSSLKTSPKGSNSSHKGSQSITISGPPESQLPPVTEKLQVVQQKESTQKASRKTKQQLRPQKTSKIGGQEEAPKIAASCAEEIGKSTLKPPTRSEEKQIHTPIPQRQAILSGIEHRSPGAIFGFNHSASSPFTIDKKAEASSFIPITGGAEPLRSIGRKHEMLALAIKSPEQKKDTITPNQSMAGGKTLHNILQNKFLPSSSVKQGDSNMRRQLLPDFNKVEPASEAASNISQSATTTFIKRLSFVNPDHSNETPIPQKKLADHHVSNQSPDSDNIQDFQSIRLADQEQSPDMDIDLEDDDLKAPIANPQVRTPMPRQACEEYGGSFATPILDKDPFSFNPEGDRRISRNVSPFSQFKTPIRKDSNIMPPQTLDYEMDDVFERNMQDPLEQKPSRKFYSDGHRRHSKKKHRSRKIFVNSLNTLGDLPFSMQVFGDLSTGPSLMKLPHEEEAIEPEIQDEPMEPASEIRKFDENVSPEKTAEKPDESEKKASQTKTNQRKKRIKKELRKAVPPKQEIPELKTEPSDEVKKPVQEGEPKKAKTTCNCKKSKCLKFYCECLSAGGFCGPDCGCVGCHNNLEHLEERNSFLKKNPDYHKTNQIIETITRPDGTTFKRHSKGCGCSSSGCSKKYCECFKFGVECTDLCKCTRCNNWNHDFPPGTRMVNGCTHGDEAHDHPDTSTA